MIGSVFASLIANPWFYEGKWGADTGMGPERNPGYMASKGALKMLSRDLAASFGPWGITVNMVSPGMIQISDRQIDTDRRQRYEQINQFERHLVDTGTTGSAPLEPARDGDELAQAGLERPTINPSRAVRRLRRKDP